MNMQPSFKQGNASQNVTTLLKCVQSADLASPDFDEDDKVHSRWLTLSSSLTTWQEVGSVAKAFKLVVAALKTCQEAQQMCKSDEMPTSGFISNIYLKNTLECLERCWAAAGGMIASGPCAPVLPTTPTHRNAAMPQSSSTPKMVPRVLHIASGGHVTFAASGPGCAQADDGTEGTLNNRVV
ncbi:hypothetical protein EI94DRAFT_1706502 [Lactarius quietus]|nr:hypothetical protein EI94DRAFT_1706502 [Lactarius quietus]